MPEFRGINVTLQSQYDAASIPEQPLFSPTSAEEQTALAPTLPLIVTVRVQPLPSSQFWISYACGPPPTGSGIRFYYFKLYIAGRCVVSWGIGEEEDWRGKTMHAIFAAGSDFNGRRVVERRALFFSHAGAAYQGKAGGFEIRVFRAKARRREEMKYENFSEVVVKGAGLQMANLGRVKAEEAQRMYTYALIDPKDEPYVTFQYMFGSPEHVSPSRAESANDVLRRGEEDDRWTRSKPAGLSRRQLSGTSSGMEMLPSIREETMSRGPTMDEEDVDANETAHDAWVSRTPSPMVSRLFERPASPPAKRKAGSAALLESVVTNVLKGGKTRR